MNPNGDGPDSRGEVDRLTNLSMDLLGKQQWVAARQAAHDAKCLVLYTASRLVAEKHSILSKVRSGMTRVVLYVTLTALLPLSQAILALVAGAVLLAVGVAYERTVIRRDLDAGLRPWLGQGWLCQVLEWRGWPQEPAGSTSRRLYEWIAGLDSRVAPILGRLI